MASRYRHPPRRDPLNGYVSLALAAAIPSGSIPFVATPSRLLTSTAYLLIAALLGCAFSLRRVLKVDPAAAIGGEQ